MNPYIGPAQARVLLALSLEPQRTCDIADSGKTSRTAAGDALKALAKKKLARKVGTGMWALETGHAIDDALDEAWVVVQRRAS